MMKKKILKVGNSFCVTVPAFFARMLGIRAGEEVRLKLLPTTGKIIYQFSSKQLSFSENFLKKRSRKKAQ